MQEGKNKFIKKLKQTIKKIKQKNKIKPILIVLIAILIFASCIIAIAIVPNIGKIIKPIENQYLEYEIKDKIEEGKYNILIKVKSEDGIEYIKCPNGNILYANGETIVGIDYQILEEVKYDLMVDVCYAKFTQNEDLKEKLLATGDEYLEEGNNWGDRIWGTVNGEGENRLGKILMKVRDELMMDQQFRDREIYPIERGKIMYIILDVDGL